MSNATMRQHQQQQQQSQQQSSPKHQQKLQSAINHHHHPEGVMNGGSSASSSASASASASHSQRLGHGHRQAEASLSSSSTYGAGEQLEDECQLWARALRLLSARQNDAAPLLADSRPTWTVKGVCLPLGLSRAVRGTLLNLCNECDQRQAVIDRLEESERHARADLRYSQEKMQLYREKLASLQQQQQQNSSATALDSARSVGFLDSVPESLLQASAPSSAREQELLGTKSVAGSRARALEARVESQAAEIVRLRKKLQTVERDEAERHRRQMEAFRSLKHRKPTWRSPLDNKMLDIIDSYETQLQRLRRELHSIGGGGGGEEEEEAASEAHRCPEDSEESAPGHGYRVTIEQLNRQIASLADQVQCLENEREVLCVELESPPTNSDHVLLTSKLQRYERLLRRHNIDAGKESEQTLRGGEYSTRVEDIDLLPLSVCRRHLKAAARQLDILDLKQMPEALADLASISDAYGVVHPVLARAQALVLDNEDIEKADAAEEDRLHQLLPRLEQWRDQMARLPELQQSLERLFLQLYPWSSLARLQATPDVGRLVAAVDRMASDEKYELAPQTREDGDSAKASESSSAASSQQPPYTMLLGMVEHFRKLFDVNKLSGVCTKMNSVYSELGVCRNAMASIRESLGLVEQTPMEAVVDAVTRLMQLERLSVNDKLQEIFSHADIQLAFERLDEYDQFFPAFEDLVTNLMAALDVSQVDEILPRVVAHKRVFDAQSGDTGT